ncbi:hypothetical protein [Microbacterium sp. CIAB417]|uniref:hypothetical protein n=1 Tax=Microbacterium sp. CIAB417 TaxID=2860287 RepID=UPI001FACD169|nr:hypothetical protein [Microbacterium sp. CIAB417]
MSQPGDVTAAKPNASLLIRGAIWIAIGALIAAALVCVVWVLIGDQDGLIGRAFLTILLLAAFAGIAILEAGLAPNRPDWLALSSMITWIIALLVGAVKIWLPEEPGSYGVGAERFFQLLLVVGILQLTLLHVRLFKPAAERYITVFTRVIYYLTLVFLVALAGMLVFYLTFSHTFVYNDLYWRIVVALAILTAVGTTLIPLLNALFAPKKQKPAVAPAATSWPTYGDGVTPLPVLADGSPDWNAYYTGHPTVQAAALPAPAYPVLGGAVAAPAAHPQEPQAPVWPPQDAGPTAAAWPADPAQSTFPEPPAHPTPPTQPQPEPSPAPQPEPYPRPQPEPYPQPQPEPYPVPQPGQPEPPSAPAAPVAPEQTGATPQTAAPAPQEFPPPPPVPPLPPVPPTPSQQ